MMSMKRELPVLSFAPFRKYPTRQEQQQYDDSREVCRNCVSGGCCSSEDPVYLTSFDVFRLAAFFDMSAATFMLDFTQERFDDPESDAIRRKLIDDPDCSIVTYLRRRENAPTSPCIFLKYVRDPDGLPRRICSVHDGRPLACREFYAHHCRLRVTGELAALQAEGFEKVRDGEITEELVDAKLATFGQHDPQRAALSVNMEYFFWLEMKRALNMDRANVEGANSYEARDFQDPIDIKLNRLLSSKYLRFEEKYGLRPRDEQLMPYAAGQGFVGSPDYERIMKILRSSPSDSLYALGNYPIHVGVRMALTGVRHPTKFSVIPDADTNTFLHDIPHVVLFPRHHLCEVRRITLRDIYAAILKGFNHLLRFASYVAAMENILEFYEPGFVESELLLMIAGFETSLNPFIARNSYFQPVKEYAARIVADCLERKITTATLPKAVFDNFRFLCRLQTIVPSLPADLQSRFELAATTVNAKLQKETPELYISAQNPVLARSQAGKHLRVKRAWVEWFDQVLDMRYAAMAGFARIDLSDHYRQSLNDLEKIPFCKSYVLDLYDVVSNLACSMSFHDTIAHQEMPYQDVAARLAAYSVGLFNRMEDMDGETSDCEIGAGFLSPIYKGLGLSYSSDPSFGLITYRLLDSQLPDGSWQTDPLTERVAATQAEYLCTHYRVTWACVDGLRPLRNDVGANAGLRLV
jgi:Fe-S-cluster containining protein